MQSLTRSSNRQTKPIGDYHNLAVRTSRTRQQNSGPHSQIDGDLWLVIPTTDGKEGLARHRVEALDHLEIGNQVRQFTLFDRAGTSDQSPFLRIDPRTLTNPQDMDWAETEGVALV